MSDETATAIGRDVREAVKTEFEASCAVVADAADAVSDAWDGSETTNRAAAVDRLAARLRETNTAGRLVEIAPLVARTCGTTLPAEPVPEPPYYVVTGEGPLIRVSLPDCDVRVLVALVVFRVSSGTERPRYSRTDDPVRIDVQVEATD